MTAAAYILNALQVKGRTGVRHSLLDSSSTGFNQVPALIILFLLVFSGIRRPSCHARPWAAGAGVGPSGPVPGGEGRGGQGR